jgi:hypothetical protein
MRVRPAAPARPAYPTVGAAVRLLFAAPIALAPCLARADATVPAPPSPRAPQGGTGTPQTPAKPKPAPAPPKRSPHLGGDMMQVEPPPVTGMAPRMLHLHPHAPGEPCFPLDADPGEFA